MQYDFNPLLKKLPQRTGPVALLCACLAALIDFSHFHRLQGSDGLMPVLVSTTHWTPFFWGQNYYGMLWPAVFSPVQGILANFLLNNAAVLFCGAAVHFAAAAFMFRRRAAVLIGGINLAAVLAWTSPVWCYDQLGPSLFFTTPLLLGIVALYLLEMSRSWPARVAAAVLMSLACWFNVSSPLPLAILAVTPHTFWRPLRQGGLPRWLRSAAPQQLGLIGLGAIVGVALMQLAPFAGPSNELLPRAEWADAIASTARNAFNGMGVAAGWPVFPLFIAGCLAAGSGLYFATCLGVDMALYQRSPRHRSGRMRLWGACCRAVALSAAAAAFICIHPWAKNNAFAARYWYPELLIAQLACIAWAVLPALGRWVRPHHGPRGRFAHPAMALTLVLCALGRFGLPALDNPRRDLQAHGGTLAEAALEHHASAVSGNYWKVWPAVLSANLTLQAQGSPLRVVALTYRAEQALEGLPLPTGDARVVAMPVGDSDGPYWCNTLGLSSLRELAHDERTAIWGPAEVQEVRR